jgi:hypothetical protein
MLHNVELHNLLCPSNIIGMMLLRGMSWIGHTARMGGGGEEDTL